MSLFPFYTLDLITYQDTSEIIYHATLGVNYVLNYPITIILLHCQGCYRNQWVTNMIKDN